MKFLNILRFHHRLQDKALVEAIRRAEEKTSGEIRVFITRHANPDPVAAAWLEFEKMNMTATRERNGVLIFVAPKSRNFAIIGDQGIHQRCSDDFWKTTAARLESAFRQGDITLGLCAAVEEIGETLSREFPHTGDDRNELPDAVERD